ncbi:MAG: type II secretion system protein [Anaerovoracaceae bacterium]
MDCKVLKNKKGFTLIELIVTLVILCIIAAIAIPTVGNYRSNAQQEARNKVAKTIYYTAQKAMTAQMTSGNKTLPTDGKVDVSKITPALDEKEVAGNRYNLSFMVLNKDKALGAPKDRNLYKFLDKYMADTNRLNDTVLVEYNTKTGKVLSAFYSDEVENIGYTPGSKYNANDRNADSLLKGDMGYYSVSNTGTPEETTPEDDTDIVQIVDYTGEKNGQGNNINKGYNYGLLTVECVLPEKVEDYESYEIKLSATGAPGSKTIKLVPGDTPKAGEVSLGGDVKTTLAEAFASPVNLGGADDPCLVPMYIETTPEGKILVLVLDSVRDKVHISENLEALGNGYFTASFTKIKEGVPTSSLSKQAHTLFAAESENGNKFEVKSIRHLNNIRYARNNADFVQTKDIVARDYVGDGSVIYFQPISWKTGSVGFNGKYTAVSEQNKYKIYNLTIYQDENKTQIAKGGLFETVGNNGIVTGVNLEYTQAYREAFFRAKDKRPFFINGTEVAGGIAVENAGEITRCTVAGRVTGKTAGGIVGTGKNGKITKSMSGAYIVGKNIGGGIAGVNDGGEVSYCETGTSSMEDPITYMGTIATGCTPYFGANSNPEVDYECVPANVRNDVTIINGDIAGGIVGDMVKGEIKYSVNSGWAYGKLHSGGIAGTNGGNIDMCYNAGKVQNQIGEVGGLAAKQTGGNITSSYNTGDIEGKCGGGIVGQFIKGKVSDCYSIGLVSTIDGRERTSGGFGEYTEANKISNCAFLRNIRNDQDSNSGCKALSAETLKKKTFAGMSNTATPVGYFKYTYPHFNVKDEACKLGTGYHRTPFGEK